jgi:hypothetical protein
MRSTWIAVVALCAACGDDAAVPDAAPATVDAAANSDAASVLAPCGTPMPTRDFDVGIAFALHPDRIGNSAQLTSFLASLPSYGELFGVQTGWDVNLDTDGVPVTVALAFGWTADNGVVVYAGIGAEPGAVAPADLDTYWETNAAAFQAAALAIVDTHHPRYLSLGIESNRWHVASADAFADLVAVHRATYDAIKLADPNVQVGAGIQLDYMRGDAERTGQVLTAHFDVLSMLAGKVDFLAVSAYPWLGMDSPAEVPTTYLSDITDQLDVPLIITETGWPSESAFVPTATEQAQVDYLCRLIAVSGDVPLAGIVYGLPFDGDFSAIFGTPVFDRLGLANADGSPKLVQAVWDELRAVPR